MIACRLCGTSHNAAIEHVAEGWRGVVWVESDAVGKPARGFVCAACARAIVATWARETSKAMRR